MQAPEQARAVAPGPRDGEEEGVEALVQGRLERLPEVSVLRGREDVRLIHDRGGDGVPELQTALGGDDPHRARAVRIDELVSAHLDDVEERPRLDEGAGEVEDDLRLVA